MGVAYNSRIITDGLVLALDAANTKSYPGILDNIVGWRLPSTYYIRGTLLDNGRTWSSEPSTGYSSVILNKTFNAGENFEVIAYWARDYRGIGMVHGPNVSVSDFTGYSVDPVGPYFGALNTSGFPSGYSATFFGQYHSPIQGQGAQTTGYWFKWARTGNTLSLQYSATSSSGPWTNILADISINSADKVIIGAGEASSTEVSDLSLISVGPGPYTWTDLSGRGNTGTLVNGVGYSASNGGALTFDGTDDYVDLGSDKVFKTTGGWTVESWVNYDVIPTTYNNTTSPANFIGSETDSTHNSWYWSVLESKLSLWNISPGVWKHGSTILQAYTWYNAVLVCYNSGTSYQMYLNGIAEGGDHTAYSWNASYSGLNIRYIGRGNSANVRLVDGKIPITKVYDRALSAAEISQNFNALRGRYGI